MITRGHENDFSNVKIVLRENLKHQRLAAKTI